MPLGCGSSGRRSSAGRAHPGKEGGRGTGSGASFARTERSDGAFSCPCEPNRTGFDRRHRRSVRARGEQWSGASRGGEVGASRSDPRGGDSRAPSAWRRHQLRLPRPLPRRRRATRRANVRLRRGRARLPCATAATQTRRRAGRARPGPRNARGVPRRLLAAVRGGPPRAEHTSQVPLPVEQAHRATPRCHAAAPDHAARNLRVHPRTARRRCRCADSPKRSGATAEHVRTSGRMGQS